MMFGDYLSHTGHSESKEEISQEDLFGALSALSTNTSPLDTILKVKTPSKSKESSPGVFIVTFLLVIATNTFARCLVFICFFLWLLNLRNIKETSFKIKTWLSKYVQIDVKCRLETK